VITCKYAFEYPFGERRGGMLWVQIGQTAGMVYRFLEKKKEASTTELLKEIKVPYDILQMALGWLAREDRIRFEKVKRSLKVSLK
jgi:hypothetical protein